MRTRTTTVATAALLLATLVSCSSGSSGKPTVAKASDTPSASNSPSPSPSPSSKTYKLGDTIDISAGYDFSAVVLAFKDKGISAGPGLESAGQKWAVAEVKVCNKDTEPFEVSPFVWALAYEDGARLEPAHITGSELPQPLYPADAKVRAGDCVRGNVSFEVPDEGRAERVLYSPGGLDEPVEWTIPKA
ncbi:DUF4352 domain-containing protein [Streptomyces sp. NPDC057298]|uniref:DUF4352 domain-containing protein n=1 Tax=Streptomyces sp. NPDC057298 TaxID=3346091 RepID=UPI00363D2437